MMESTDRLAWSQTRHNSRGNGLYAFKDQQPQTQVTGKKAHLYERNYYVKSKGKA